MSKLIKSYEQLMATKFTRYAGNPIIPHTGQKGNWKEWQVQESFVFPDPKDASKLIMFYAGQAPGVGRATIGRASATVADPFTWKDDAHNPIVSPGINRFNSQWLRLDTMLYLDGVYWLYSTGMTDNETDAKGSAVWGFNSIMLAKSTDGVNFTWEQTPILLPQEDERDVSQAAVLKDGDTWYMYYSYRTKAGLVLPGIRLAVSTDGVTWRRTGKEIISTVGGTYDSKYYEWHQALKLGDDYVLLSEVFDSTHWSIGVAHSKSPTDGWQKSPVPILQHSGTPGAFDEHHVATGGLFDIGDRAMIFYTGGNNIQNYILSTWDIGVTCSEPLRR